MQKVQRAQLAAIAWSGGAAVVVGTVTASALAAQPGWPQPTVWLVALGYLLVATALLLVGLRRRTATRFGWANAVTATRASIVGMIAGLVAGSFAAPIPVALVVSLAIPALVLDAVDGWVARRTNSSSELGARFDMEVDAFLLLVLSVFVARGLGPWVLAIGLMRYAFVAAGWVWPRLRRTLPPRYWRKVVTAVSGIALTVAASGLAPIVGTVLVAIALVLLLESFGRDLLWLLRATPRRDDSGWYLIGRGEDDALSS